LTPAQALACVFCSGVLFLLISLSPLTRALETGIPDSLKHGITAGIGLFLAFIGLQKGGLVVSSATSFVALGSLKSVEPLLTLLGIIIIGALYIRKIKGSFIIGMVFISVLHFFLSKEPPANSVHLNKSHLAQGFFNFDFSHMFSSAFFLSVFSLTMLIVFENMGLLYGMLPDTKRFTQAYRASAASSILASIFGTSPTISAAESASGIEEGGKTGLTAIVAGCLFLAAFLVIPFIGYIPDSAIAPILIILGGIMMQNVKWIPFHDFSESFPAFLIILLIPLTYSIADGLAFGFIAYPLFKVLLGKRKHVSPILYVIALLFLLHFIAISFIA
jgi:AGZA family xanthine/uracil permease-like MFS transporter